MMTSPAGTAPGSAAKRRTRRQGFTLIELICVMALLIVVVAMVSPQLSGFFRGRNLDSEVRRFYSLTLHGQQRAISEGMPMLLWIDPDERAYGLLPETIETGTTPRMLRYELGEDVGVQLQRPYTSNLRSGTAAEASAQNTRNLSRFGRNAGVIRFAPDGSFDESSLLGVGFYTRNPDGSRPASSVRPVWVAQRYNGLSYEIPTNTPSFQR